MEGREQIKLEEERSKNMKKINRYIDDLDYLYRGAIHEKDDLVQRLYHYFRGDPQDFSKCMRKIEQNVAEFEQIARRQRQLLEEEKRKIAKNFEKRMR